MADEEFMSRSMAAPEDESDYFYVGIYNNPSSKNMSRLSVCTSSFTTSESCDFYEDNHVKEGSGGGNGGYSSMCGGEDADAVGSYFSMLSIENFDADAEFSEDEETEEGGVVGEGSSSFSSCSMLGPSPREVWRARQGMAAGKEECTSDKETRKHKENRTNNKKKKMKRLGFGSESGSGRWGGQNCNDGGGGESECGGGGSGGGGNGLMVMTRPKGGNSRLWMDMEEVKACRELGLELELEHERTIEIPGQISISGSVDTGGSSGGNSPVSNWRISSPGKIT